ncbi:Nin-like protein [Haliscomenobacter hydrossis]|nr:Nin-like protein [Haliscomenobacter hydrossis]
MMLKIMLDNGQIDKDTIIAFANTGKEQDETLDFVHECGQQWNVPIVWLEYRSSMPKFEVVSYETASRRKGESAGRPFMELLASRQYLPNPTQRICTAELKIKTIRRYVRSLGHRGDIPSYIGLRFDEQSRVARKKAQNAAGKESEYCYMPLYDLRITVKERDAFWKSQPFDLKLSSQADNCDLCFMKGKYQLIWAIRADPEAVEWWINAEKKSALSAKRKRNAQFRKEYSYTELKHIAMTQTYLPFFEEPNVSLTCACTD